MAMNGTDFLILINIGTDLSPVFQAVGSQRDATVDESLDLIDVSNKESRARKVLAGRSSASISLDALYIPDDAAYAVLKAAVRDGTLVTLAREEYGVVTETAPAMVTSMSEAFPDQDGATVSIKLDIAGDWVPEGS